MVDYQWGFYCPHAEHDTHIDEPAGRNRWTFSELERLTNA